MSSNTLPGINYFEWEYEIPSSVTINADQIGEAGYTSMVYRISLLKALLPPTPVPSPNMVMAVFLIAASTYSAKQPQRMAQVINGIADRAGCLREVNTILDRMSGHIGGIRYTGQKMASAFPDFALVFSCIKSAEEVSTLDTLLSIPVANKKIPTVLKYAQSLQLALDDDMQKYADCYNCFYWLSVVSYESEIPDGPDFNVDYFKTSRADKYKFLVAKDMFSDEVKVAALESLSAPYNFKKLLLYQRCVKQYFLGTRRMSREVFDEISTVLGRDLETFREALSPISEVTIEYHDMRRDGRQVLIRSGTTEYKTAQATSSRVTTSRPNNALLRNQRNLLRLTQGELGSARIDDI